MVADKIRGILVTLIVVVATVLTGTGCETVKGYAANADRGDALKGAVFTGVALLVREDPEMRDSILDGIAKLRNYMEGEPDAKSGDIIQTAVSYIDWDEFSPTQRIVAERLLNSIRIEIAKGIEVGGISRNRTEGIQTVLTWAETAAVLF